jgi:hypothetical protein
MSRQFFHNKSGIKNVSNKLLTPPVQLHTKFNFTLFVWIITHHPALLFSQNKSTPTNQPIVFFHNKSTPVTNQASKLLVFKDNFQVMHKNQTKPASLACANC